MKKTVSIICLLLLLTVTAKAQLRVSSAGHVGVRALPTTGSLLNVGADYAGSDRVGIYSTPIVSDMNNIGVEGVVEADTGYTNDTNFGVLGIISLMNNNHGRNYGVSGMLGLGYSQTFNGAGVYGANSAYYSLFPSNLQGLYAGYFDGPVVVTGTLTAPNYFTLSDA